jgi:hypothetical protein
MKLEDQAYNKKILDANEGNNLISDYFKKNQSFLVARSGSIECNIVSYAVKQKANIPLRLKNQALINAGIYPNNEENLIKFAYDYCKSIKNIDIMGVWAVIDYDWLANTYCPNAHYIRLWGLEPYHYKNPWSKNLEGKNVLVIHPFEKSIHHNYKNREKLFKNPEVLPEFNLLTIKAEQNQSNSSSNYFESMQRTIDKIHQVDFDVAIIGCGASGLPIASYIKGEINKIAIHMGGATQVLFGIIGKRWESYPQFKNIINNYWTRPLPEEMPSHYLKLDKGCYW